MKACSNDNCSAAVWDDDQTYCSAACQILHRQNALKANAAVTKRGAIEGGLRERLGLPPFDS
jgi:predicted nucleic acid-binding Zn ribbon protein